MFEKLCDKVMNISDKFKIAIVGKYCQNNDS